MADRDRIDRIMQVLGYTKEERSPALTAFSRINRAVDEGRGTLEELRAAIQAGDIPAPAGGPVDVEPIPAPEPTPSTPTDLPSEGEVRAAEDQAFAEQAADALRSEQMFRFEDVTGLQFLQIEDNGQFTGVSVTNEEMTFDLFGDPANPGFRLAVESDGDIDAVLSDPTLSDAAKIAKLVKDFGFSSTLAAQTVKGEKPAAGTRGFAPQAKSTGTLANGTPFVYDPNQPAATAFTEAGTGRVLGPSDFGPADEFLNITDQRTGETFRVNTATGEQTSLGTFDFPQIDPERTFQREGAQFGAEFGFAQAGAAEAAALARAGGVETAGLDRAALAENARQANLGAATRGFETVAGLAPQLSEQARRNAEFVRETFTTPADFGFAAATQRGEVPGFPEQTQADILNKLRQDISGFNQTLGGFNPQVGTFQPPPAFVPPPAFGAAPSPASAAGFTPTPGPVATSGPAQPSRTLLLNTVLERSGFSPEDQSRVLASFGFADPAAAGGHAISEGLISDLFSGDQAKVGGVFNQQAPSGSPFPTATPLPGTEAPAGSLFQQTDQGFDFRLVNGTLTAIPKELPQAAGGGFFSEPVEVHDDEVVTAVPGGFFVSPKGKTKPKKKAQEGGFFGFGLPELPTIPEFTQEQIQGFALDFAPPAIRDVFLGGGQPSPLRFPNIPGFQLPTARGLAALTPRETEAASGFLAPFNTSLSDIETAVQQRFGRPQGRSRARLQSGFQ